MSPAEYRATLLDPLGPVVNGMERAGVPIDRSLCIEIRDQAEKDSILTKESLDNFCRQRGIEDTNWNYAQWLAEFMHGSMTGGLKIPKSPYWKKGKVKDGEVKTDDKALEFLSAKHPEYRQLLTNLRTYRRQTRVANYTDSWVEIAIPHPSGIWVMHPSFGLSHDADDRPGAKTGRFGVKNPPLQQVPRDEKKDPYRVRRCIIAPPGRRLVVADYAQLEIVVLAHICQRLFGKRPGNLASKVRRGAPDMHSATAKIVFGDYLGVESIRTADVGSIKKLFKWYRDIVKAIRYGLNYGKGDYGFGWTLFDVDGMTPLGEERAGEMRRALLQLDPEIAEFQEVVRELIQRDLGIQSLLGRWCLLPDANINSPEWAQHRAERQADNWPMQTGAAEIVILAMIKQAVNSLLRSLGFVLILQVHDELIGHVPEDNADEACHVLRGDMENCLELEADLQAEPHHGLNWEEAKG